MSYKKRKIKKKMKTKKLKQFRKTKKHYKKINKKLRKTLNKKGGGRGQECKLIWEDNDISQQTGDAEKCRYYAYPYKNEWYMMRDIGGKRCGVKGKLNQRRKCPPDSKAILDAMSNKRSTTKDDITEATNQLNKPPSMKTVQAQVRENLRQPVEEERVIEESVSAVEEKANREAEEVAAKEAEAEANAAWQRKIDEMHAKNSAAAKRREEEQEETENSDLTGLMDDEYMRNNKNLGRMGAFLYGK